MLTAHSTSSKEKDDKGKVKPLCKLAPNLPSFASWQGLNLVLIRCSSFLLLCRMCFYDDDDDDDDDESLI
jgi:hypothetical protein